MLIALIASGLTRSLLISLPWLPNLLLSRRPLLLHRPPLLLLLLERLLHRIISSVLIRCFGERPRMDRVGVEMLTARMCSPSRIIPDRYRMVAASIMRCLGQPSL